ncbi:hypothetical protein KHQ06_14330 [Nocardia tengchongensis]|uniref:Uncharacterized protein n=1 Tax=Nocardia tengchongensis TaxID=2055889 RepID=A0ABX8CZH2_9NOCA|nr:hypothetical protein [Nocardia tengchongensis]QVI23880.1 hypothetical protein KHQ06_14330 [Nocardia tengchongensis]
MHARVAFLEHDGGAADRQHPHARGAHRTQPAAGIAHGAQELSRQLIELR